MYKYTSELRADELGTTQFIYSNSDVFSYIAMGISHSFTTYEYCDVQKDIGIRVDELGISSAV
jgi:hypothetical protein